MPNKLPWFTHDHDSRHDLFIQAAEDRFGHFGYAAYFKLLEILHQHGIGDELRISPARLCQELRSRRAQVRLYLDFCQGSAKVKYTWNRDEVWIQIKKVRERWAKLKSKIPRTFPEDSLKVPEKEKERKKEKEKKKRLSASPNGASFQKPKKQTDFQKVMDGFIRMTTPYKPGNPNPAQKAAVEACYKREGRLVSELLRRALGDPDAALDGIRAIGERMNSDGLRWSLGAVNKNFSEYIANPEGYRQMTKRGR